MKIAKKILQHNVNNFRHTVFLNHDLYNKGIINRPQFLIGLLYSLKERIKIFHWRPSTFFIISLFLYIIV